MSFSNVVSVLALTIAMGTGAAYAANTIASSDIIDGEVKTADIAANAITTAKVATSAITAAKIGTNAVTAAKIGANAVTAAKVLDDSLAGADVQDETLTGADVLDGSIDGADVSNESLTSSDLATDSVNATEVADNSIDSGEIVDFGLTNQDVGVLFAQVNADGTIFNSSGGVTSSPIGTGTYQVDFGRNISSCGFTATQGEGGVGGAGGAIMGVTDRSSNPNAVFATARAQSGAMTNTAFQLMVVC